MAGRSMNILNVADYGRIRVWQYGLDRVYDEFQVALDIHNARMQAMYDLLVGVETTDKRHRFGAVGAQLKMVRVGRETGRAHAQSVSFNPYEIGLPVEKFELSQSWTKRYAQRETVERMNAQLNAAMDADKRLVKWQIGVAIFDNVNYDFLDEEVNGQVYPVKRLLNSDGQPIPMGPNGEPFDGASHNHYLVFASISYASMKVVQDHLVHHTDSGESVIYGAYEDTAAYQAIVGFVPAEDGRVIKSALADRIDPTLDRQHPKNRFLGFIKDGPEVWIRPYIPAGWGYGFIAGGDLDAPLAQCHDELDGKGLIVAEPERLNSKQEARSVARIGGFAVLERRNGVAFKIDGALGAYTAPAVFNKNAQPDLS